MENGRERSREHSRKNAMFKGLYVNLEPLVLASASPRRLELLSSMGVQVEVEPSGVEESKSPAGNPLRLVQHWALEKARAVSQLKRAHWVLAADTAVVLEGRVFGKPRNDSEAIDMLEALSGKCHRVISAFCLKHGGRGVEHVSAVSTRVHFKSLLREEMAAYVRTGECLDKAGAYGIQGFGAFMVRALEGSYTNVVGLPLCETLECLMAHGVIEPARE